MSIYRALSLFLVALLALVLAGEGPAEAGLQPADRANTFVNSMGVSTHFRFKDSVYDNDFAYNKAKLAELGIKHFRDKAQINEPGNASDEVLYAHYRQIHEATGGRFLLTFDPDLEGTRDLTPGKLGRIEDYMQTSTGSALENYAGWNEPNTGNPPGWQQDTIDYQCDLYNSAHDPSNRGIPVAGPGLNRLYYPENRDGTIDFSKIPKMHACVDVAFTKSYTHEYPSTLKFHSKTGESVVFDRDISVARHIGGTGKPLFSGEMGYTTAPDSEIGVPEDIQAQYLLRTWTEYARRGHLQEAERFNRAYVYELRDFKTDPPPLDHPQAHFGLLRYNGTEKPSYRATENLIDILQDPGPAFVPSSLDYAFTDKLTSTHRLLLQDRPSRGGAFYILIWREVMGWDPRTDKRIEVDPDQLTINLAKTASKVEVFLPHSITSSGPADNAETHPARTLWSVRNISLGVRGEVQIVKVTP